MTDTARKDSPIPPGDATQIGNYKLGTTLGVGSFGKVKLAAHATTGQQVAVKILNRKVLAQMKMDSKIKREIQIMKIFRHPHIVRLYEAIESPDDIYMIMEYVKGGELFDFITSTGRLPDDRAQVLFQQIICGVEYCHSHGVVHRDLKPENLLLDQEKFIVKIADFGLSNLMQDGEFFQTSCGSPNYAAPEIISGHLYAGPEVDVWSCGVILFTLVCAKLPFDDDYIPVLFKKIKEGIFEIPPYVSEGCTELLKGMLKVDPLQRMTIADIRQHPWFLENLPEYLTYSPPATMALRATGQDDIDDDVIEEMINRFPSLNRHVIVDAITKHFDEKTPSDIAVTYYLLYDSNRIYDCIPPHATREDGTLSPRPNSPTGTPQNSPLLRSAFRRPASPSPLFHPFESRPKKHLAHTVSYERGRNLLGDHFDPAEAKRSWQLGLRTKKSQKILLGELYRVLQLFGCSWKVLSPYNIRVIHDFPETKKTLKMGFQVYKVQDELLLDIKKIEGEVLSHFDFCSKFISELHL